MTFEEFQNTQIGDRVILWYRTCMIAEIVEKHGSEAKLRRIAYISDPDNLSHVSMLKHRYSCNWLTRLDERWLDAMHKLANC